MTRRAFVTIAGGLLIGGWVASAQPTARPNLLVLAAATTETNFPYKVTVNVDVENRGQAPSTDGNVQLVLKPQGAQGNRPKSDVPTMWDPVSEMKPVPALQPGEKKTVSFETQYYSGSSFKNRSGSFKARNVDPTGVEVTVTIQATLK